MSPVAWHESDPQSGYLGMLTGENYRMDRHRTMRPDTFLRDLVALDCVHIAAY